LGPIGVERVPRNEFWLFAMGCAGLAANRLAHRELAAMLYEELVTYREFLVGNVAPIVGPVSQVAGLVAATSGQLDIALELLADARQRVEILRCPPWLVECLRAEAAALDAAGREGASVRRQADDLAASLGMACPAAREGPLQGIASLTSREREVLALIAAGRSNHEISDELYISYRTTKTHVSNILLKLGARDRAAAAMVARQAGPAGG
jgi:DNA-binding CsgD family transcriptional regulator